MTKIAEMTDKAFEEYVAGLTDKEELSNFIKMGDGEVFRRFAVLINASGNESSPLRKNPLIQELLEAQKSPEVLKEIGSFDLNTAFNKAEILKEIDGFNAEAAFKKDVSVGKAFTSKGPQLYQQSAASENARKFNEDWKVIPYTEPKKLF